MEWSVGITTAARTPPTLSRTIASLAAAGWPEPIVFADGDCDLGVLGEAVHREQAIGSYANWWSAAFELFARRPHTDRFLLVEDDAVFCRNLRTYLERYEPPATAGVCNLFAAKGSEGGRIGFHPTGNGIGALAYVWTSEQIQRMLRDEIFFLHRRHHPKFGNLYQDKAMGRYCRERGLDEMVHTPSLCQHIGNGISTCGHESHGPHRYAKTFVGEDFDALELAGRFGEPPP